jgi:thioredoxin-like negative regulator of GroEL
VGAADVTSQNSITSRNEVRIRERADGARTRTNLGARLDGRKIEATAQPIQGRAATAIRQQAEQTQARRRVLGSRMDGYLSRTGSAPRTFSRDARSDRVIGGIHVDRVGARPSYLHARYYDRPDLITHSDRHMNMYYDSYHRLHHRVIWPSYYYPVCYPYGSYFSFHYVWPYYQRQYLWVSLGGWWPYDYSYMRYYWYGWHPYLWYGYYPVPYEVGGYGDSYNYYTYNYYPGDGSAIAQSEQPVDPSTWAEVQQKLDQQKAQPAAQTLADTRFEEGVQSFEAGNFGAAAEKFAEAMSLAPEDMILPYAYAQALFADGHYSKAAEVLRTALQKVTPEKEGVFFPRGLYANDDVLYGQIEKLVDKADLNNKDSDLQLLLGYNLLGVGETGYARDALEQASQDPKNAESAQILLNVLEKMESKAGAALKSEAAPATSGTDVQAPAEAQSEAVPETPAAEAVPLSNSLAPADQAAPVGPAQKPSPADKPEDKATAPDGSGAGSVPNVVPPAGGGDNQGAAPIPSGNISFGEIVSGELRADGADVPRPLHFDRGSAMGFAGLGFMTLLGCTAVGLQLRHLNDTRV